MSDLDWLAVWLQGGPADGWRYATMIEPPQTIYVIPDPILSTQWVRVSVGWPDALAYRRVPEVEQLDRERIYYPVES
jgi:hypothetical protein